MIIWKVISNTRLMLRSKIMLFSFDGQRFSCKLFGACRVWLVTAFAEIEQLLLLRLYRLHLIIKIKKNCLIFLSTNCNTNILIFNMTRATKWMQMGQMWLRCWAQWHWYFTHFKLFYFPNVLGLVQRIVRFIMRTELKASYRTVNTNTRIVTPLLGSQSAAGYY